ncbi:MAG: hypothetical protein A2Y20_01115 [Firmicutes bacterium GWF2_51_9]|nr:MAG: hypothetical protein A2Y20_01115 [Firmicutes bacterium GWF2_51_9]OGS58335.1 MAG: hypothetical protein A2Y19_08470 [Firmicutes bacterium GWE2_51_13]HBZ40812.1 hypothetical protein [Erysipelotrichaceae bacterium]
MKPKTREAIVYLATLVLSVLIAGFASNYYTSKQIRLVQQEQYGSFFPANVTQIISDVAVDDPEILGVREIVYKVVITDGDFENREVLIRQTMDEVDLLTIYPVRVNDEIIVNRSVFGDQVEWKMTDFKRENGNWFLAGLFFVLIVLLGRWKGLNSVVSLAFTVFAVFQILIPAILARENYVLVTLAVCVYVTFMNFLLVSGLTRKTIAAALGCIGGLGVAAVVATLAVAMMRLSGISEEEFVYLINIADSLPIDIRGLLFVSVSIGALGAVMDVSMSIASALEELVSNVDGITPATLVSSGMNIGRDTMGTMTNTLILAYIGSSLPTLLLLVIYSRPYLQIANSEYVAHEVIQAIAGSLGILFTIPITSILSAFFLQRHQTKSLKG